MAQGVEENKPASGAETDGLETIVVRLGVAADDGDRRRSFRFRGRELAYVRTYEGARSRDDRGVDYTLYAVSGGYRVLVAEWSRWQGEIDRYRFLGRGAQETYEALENVKGNVLSAAEVVEIAPVVWNEAVKAGKVAPVIHELG